MKRLSTVEFRQALQLWFAVPRTQVICVTVAPQDLSEIQDTIRRFCTQFDMPYANFEADFFEPLGPLPTLQSGTLRTVILSSQTSPVLLARIVHEWSTTILLRPSTVDVPYSVMNRALSIEVFVPDCCSAEISL